MSRVLVVGDMHLPWIHPGYLSFIKDMAEQWDTDKTVFIGDVVDLHSISFHQRRPDMPGPSDEHEQALEALRPWTAAFPEARVCIGNHDERLFRKAGAADIPDKFLRTYKEVWDTPKWDWQREHRQDSVIYRHGTGASGIHPAYMASLRLCCSIVIGHTHTNAGIKWVVGPDTRHFGMDVGCGVDQDALAFAYALENLRRSVLACGVVIDGMPFSEIMPLSKGEKYHRSRFKKGTK